MGWNQGLGLCLLKESILMFKPTHIIQINHPIEANKNMPVLDINWLNSANGWPAKKNNSQTPNQINSMINDEEMMNVDIPMYKLYAVKSAVPKIKSNNDEESNSRKKFSPRDHRNLAIISYFSRLQNTNTFVPIHHLRPYRIAWSKIGIHVSHMRVDLSQLFNVFNASLVGLCNCDPKYVRFYCTRNTFFRIV